MSTFRLLAAGVIASLAIGACSKKGAGPDSELAPPPEPSATATPETTVSAEPAAPPALAEAEPAAPAAPVEPPPAALPLTDAQIAKILQSVDQGEIEQAKIAQKKSKNPRVKKYAQHLIQQHTQSKQKGTKLTKKEQITPADSPVAAQLTEKANQILESLKSAEGTSFDPLYVDKQAQQHQEVLELVDTQLMPSATDEDLKSLLGEVRTMIEKHAEEAKQIQQTMASAEAGPNAMPATP